MEKYDKLLKEIRKNFDVNQDFFFDYCISNPPYQIFTKDTSDKPIFHLFIDIGAKISKESIMITPARFLFGAGKTPKDWNDKILYDKDFEVLYFEADSKKIFQTADIKGGVCITKYQKGSNKGGLDGLYIPFPELRTIKKKIASENTMDKICFGTTRFNLDKVYADFPHYKKIIGSVGKEKRMTSPIFSQLPEIFSEEKSESAIGIWGLKKDNDINNAKNRAIKYINKKYVDDTYASNLNAWKVILPGSNGSGSLGETISTPMIGNPMIGNPMIGNTQTFISFGKFDTQQEAENCMKYIKTKFCRAILGILKVTQSNKKEVWKFCPVLDWKAKEVCWEKSISEIDQYLYKKFNLSKEEIQFIENNIREMK